MSRFATILLMGIISLGSSLHRVMAHGDMHVQFAQLRQEIANDPDGIGKRLHLAQLLYAHGDTAAAGEMVGEVLQKQERCGAALILRAKLAADAGRLTEGLAALDRCEEVVRSDVQFLEVRARLRQASAEWSGAASDWEAVIKTKPSPVVEDFLGWMRATYELGKDRRVEPAMAIVEAGLTRVGRVPSLYLEAAAMCSEAKQAGKAADWIARLRAEAPVEKTRTYLQQGDFLHEAGREAEARTAWEAGLREWELQPERRKNLAIFQELKKTLQLRLQSSN